jgi:hypothetical protein
MLLNLMWRSYLYITSSALNTVLISLVHGFGTVEMNFGQLILLQCS